MEIPAQSIRLRVYAGYHQFYLKDANPTGCTGNSDFWTQEASRDRIAVNPGILGIGTGSYGEVPVEIALYAAKPALALDNCDHCVEASIALYSGELIIYGCPDPEEVGRMVVTPGVYRVRIDTGNLGSVVNEEGQDHYKVSLWPEKNAADPVVLKRWGSD